ncbi:hypothetical protein Tco_0499098 [Tanacetum coccineum]
MRCCFFWGFKESLRGIYWVKWKSMLLDSDKGGLGIGSLQDRDFYGEDRGFYSSSNSSMVSGVWCDIIKASASIDSIDPDFKNSFYIKVSNGSNVSFWKDVWCRDRVRFMDAFPRLYALDSIQECSVSDRWHFVDGSWSGNWN